MKKVNHSIITAWVVLVLIAVTAGCGQNSDTVTTGITGTWFFNTIKSTSYKAGVVTRDTTATIPAGYLTVTYTSDGRMFESGSLGVTDTVNYSLSGNVLHITNNGSMNGTDETVLQLDAHNLVLEFTNRYPAPPNDSIHVVYTASR